jgi:hypothetical protein
MIRLVLLCVMVAATGCAKSDARANNRDTMTRRQKDSVLGQSEIPGAHAVTKALRAADSVKAHTTDLDTIRP